jgi:hypothetical protein
MLFRIGAGDGLFELGNGLSGSIKEAVFVN